MSTKTKRKEIALNTVDIVESGCYTANDTTVDIGQSIATARAETVFISPHRFAKLVESAGVAQDASKQYETIYEVVEETTLMAIERLGEQLRATSEQTENAATSVASTSQTDPVHATKVEDVQEDSIYVLNFASAKNPGGGFLNGARAQEETLARSSALFHCIHDSEMYGLNRRDNKQLVYHDAAIYTPNCPVFKDDDGNLFAKPYSVAFVTMPAPNAGCLKRGVSQDALQNAMTRRIVALLRLAVERRHTHLILGAFGCGVFRNDVRQVARIFRQVLDGQFAGQFKHVSLSITPDNCQKFREAFEHKG